MTTTWDLIGNAGTVPGQNFLGTQDTQPLVISTDAMERMRITPNGNVGINTAQPSAPLDVKNTFATANNPAETLRLEVSSSGPGAGPFIQFQDSATTNMARIGAIDIANFGGALAFSTKEADGNGGSSAIERMRLDNNGNLGIGTASPSAQLSVVASGAAELIGAAHSTTLLTSAGPLGTAVNSEQALASFGFNVDNANNVSLGIRAVRTSVGVGWPTTALGLGMDVDDTVRAGASLFLNSFGNVGIGTPTPGQKLSIRGDLSVFVPASGNTIRALTLDVESFETISNASGSHFLLVRDIGAAPPYGLAHFLIRGDGNVGIGTGTPSAKLTVNGDVSVSGDVVLTGADCAEEFDIAEAVDFEAGIVMVIDQDGYLQQSQLAYDTRVAGVISGAGDYQPGLILDRRQSQESRLPVALVGKVYCKVDAQYAPIEVGDLLTTSETPGHAMKAEDPRKAFGAVLGKALRGLSNGKGLVPILVALQ